jgi:hypothetical protein
MEMSWQGIWHYLETRVGRVCRRCGRLIQAGDLFGESEGICRSCR